MRRILPAAALLLALAAALLAWRIRPGSAGEAARGRGDDGDPAARATAELAAAPRASADRGRRREAPGARPEAVAEPAGGASSGLSILLLDPEDRPMPGQVLDVAWLGDPGEGEFQLRGTTDAEGLLAAAIPDARRIEGIALEEGSDGPSLWADGPFEAAPDRPTVVVVQLPRPARVSGIVRDEQGRPVAGARVEVEPEAALGPVPFVEPFQPPKAEAIADAEGRFSLATRAGCVALTPAADGYDASEVALACLAADATTALDLVLQGSSRTLQVEVRAGGRPIESPVLVTALRPDGSPSAAGLREPLRIDRGAVRVTPSLYSVGISRDGDWTIVVSVAKGFAEARVPVPPGDERLVVELRPAAPDPRLVHVRGTVTSEGGAPVAAEVELRRGPDFDWGTSGRSDELGRFDLELLPEPPATVFLAARARGFGRATLGPIELDRLPASVDLVLGPERTIAGVVLDPDGRPIAAHATIRGTASSPIGFDVEPPAEGADVGEEGAFSFVGLPPGKFAVFAVADDRSRRLPPGCAVAEAGEQDLRITLGSGLEGFASIEGTVREAGTGSPIAGARIAAGTARGGGWSSGDAYSAEDGSFALRGCPSEVLTLHADAAGHALFETAIGPLPPGRRALDLELQPARTLRLLVVDPAGAPRPGVFVSAVDADGGPILLRDAAGHAGDDSAITDLAGRVDLHGLPATKVAVLVGRSAGGDRFVTNAAYEVPNEAQPERLEVGFDLRLQVDAVQRIVLTR